MINEIAGLFPRVSSSKSSEGIGASSVALPWHYRSVAEWWPGLGASEADAEALRQLVRCTGQPGLEVGCGSGRRVQSCRRAGLDVDGCEASPALLELCRQQSDGNDARLYCQALHDLELPRRYRCVYARGVLGGQSSQERDVAGLSRLHRLLEPGGLLVLDHPAPWGAASRWMAWIERQLGAHGEPALPVWQLRARGGHESLHLWSRVYEYRTAPPRLTYTVRAQHVELGQAGPPRAFALYQRFYLPGEVRRLLQQAGFEPRRLRATFDPARQLQVWFAEKAPLVRRRAACGPLGPVAQAGAIGFGWPRA